MPTNGHTIGRDVSVQIVTPNGILVPKTVTGFNSKPETNDVKIKPLNGPPQFAHVPDGWSLSFDIERANADIETYFANLEEGYYRGDDINPITITETIREVGGGISQWRYEGVSLKLEDGGSKAADQTVKQKVSGMASIRRRVA